MVVVDACIAPPGSLAGAALRCWMEIPDIGASFVGLALLLGALCAEACDMQPMHTSSHAATEQRTAIPSADFVDPARLDSV